MPQNNNYKQDFLAIKYEYDTQCSISEDVLTNMISNLDTQIKLSGQPVTAPVTNPLSQSCGSGGRPSSDGRIRLYNKAECEQGLNGIYIANGECFKRGGGSYSWDCRSLNTMPVSEPSNNVQPDVSGAFQPIGQYYSNLLDIKKRLNKFLEDASDEIGESQSYLANEERYDNRAHPENSVSSKEIAYGLFSEVRPSTIPILMALGTFMASVSILMIFQMVGFTSQINVPPAVIAFQTWLATPGQVPAYQNPMILGGVITVLSVAVVLLGLMYLRSRQ